MQIPLINLLWMLIPVSIVIYFYIQITKDAKTPFLALFRMVIQLLLIGYLLVYIFNSKTPLIVGVVLFIMLVFASIISLRPLEKKSFSLYKRAFFSISIGGLSTLFIVIFLVLKPKVFYEPKVVIPLAGMAFANAMNSLSIYVERFYASHKENEAFKASLIPIINSFFAVGLVSLPGMMTGQILSGVDPLIAVRYQILVMLMVLSSSGLSVIIFSKLNKGFKE